VQRSTGRRVDVVIVNTLLPDADVLARYAREEKRPLALGRLPKGVEVVEGGFWCTGIARHDRRRLSYAVWTVLSQRLLR
jgi:hypothetical protein